MDCAPLAVIDLDQLTEAVKLGSWYIVWLALAFGWVGWAVAHIPQGIAYLIRRKAARMTFAQRAELVEQRRRQSFALWTRIAARNKREAARLGAHG